MAWYKTGLINVTQGSNIVTGIGTTFLSATAGGDLFTRDGSKIYEVESVIDNNTLKLATEYAEATALGVTYKIARLSTVNISTVTLANQVSTLLTSWQVRENEYKTWQGGGAFSGFRLDGTPADPAESDPLAGYYPLTDLSGTIQYVMCPAKATSSSGALTYTGEMISAAEDKNSPVDGDYIGLADSTANMMLRKLSWSGLKATLKSYFDSVVTTLTGKTLDSPIVTGVMTIPAGTAAAPSIAITGAINNGIYSPGFNSLAFSTGGAARMDINSNGNVLIGTLADNASGCKLQVNSRVYTNGIVFPDIPVPTPDINTLDYYKENIPWTPVIAGSITAGVTTTTYAYGNYHRIGSTVFFDCEIHWTSHTGTGALIIAGLPFMAGAQNSAAQMYQVSPAMMSGVSMIAVIPATSSAIFLKWIHPETGLLMEMSVYPAGGVHVTGFYTVY